MAYALQFDGVNDYVTLSSMVGGAYADRVNVNQDWSLTFRFARAGASTYVHRLLSSTSGTSDELLMRKSDGLFRVTGLSGSHSWSGVPMPTTETEYRLERVVGTKQLELFVDSVSQGTRTGIVTIFNFNVVGVKGASGYINGKLYSLSYDSVNSGASLYLDPSATGGTGSILEDTVGTNNGTLVNFPTDNSQWVRYDVFPTEFTRLGSLTTPSVTGSASDLPTLVKYEDFTSTMLASLDAGGGDLRFSSDVDGLYPLACEVVTFTKATGDVVWVKVPAVSTGALIYVWGDNTGAIQPAVDAAFGRNAVWVDYHVVTTDGVTDRTGNTTLTNANLSAGATFNGVQSVRFNGVSSRIDALLSSISHPFAMSVWCDFDVLGDTIMGVADKSVTNRFHRVVTSSTSNSLLAQSYAGATRSADSGIDPLTGGFRFCAGVYESASSRKITIDSSAFVTNTATATTPTLDRFTVGTDADSTPFSWLDGDAIYFKLYNFAPSQAYLDVEYDNQSAVGAWWTATDTVPAQGFTRLGSLTAPAVTGSAADLPTLVKFEDFTATMLASLDAGGGDLRFSSDEAGTTQLACEVVTFTKATGDVVWVKVPAVSTGALIYVWGDNTGATQPAVDAAFGRNAVWSAFSFYSHDGGVTESTASLAMIDDGSGAVGTGQPSGADDLTAPKQRLSDASIGDTVGNYTLTSWHNGNSAGTFISRRDGSINQYQTGLTGSGSIFEYFYQDSSGTFTQFAGSALSGWHKADYVITGTSCELFIDGVSRNTIVISKGSQPAVPLRLGFRGNGGLGTVGFAYANRIGESSVCSSAKSSTQIDIEYDNQSATGAWWTATDAGGGGTVGTITQSTASFAQSLSGSVVNSYSGSIDQSTASFSQSAIGSVVIPAITGTIALSVASFAQSLSGNVVSSAVSGNITQTLSVFSQSLAGNTVLPGVVGVITQSTPAFTQSLVGSTAEQIAGVITQSTSRFTQSLVGSIPASWIDKPTVSTAWSDNAAAVTVWTDK